MSFTTPPEGTRCANCNKSPAEDASISLKACSRCKDKFYCNSACQTAAWPFHKANCKRANYTLKFHLCPNDITDPAVTRTLSVPATTTFARLHEALQVAFGWANTHAYDFAVLDPDYEADSAGGPGDLLAYIQKMAKFDKNGGEHGADDPREYMLRISQQGSFDPSKPGFRIDRMHEGKRKHPRCVEKDANKTKLFQVLDDAQYAGKKFEYTYDFGDNWDHVITVEGRSKAGANIVCLDGTGHGVAEDVGSTHGWKALKEAYRSSTPTGDQKEKMHWFEHMTPNKDPRGLYNGREHEWSKEGVNRHLAAIGL